jgi:hypothetical protein
VTDVPPEELPADARDALIRAQAEQIAALASSVNPRIAGLDIFMSITLGGNKGLGVIADGSPPPSRSAAAPSPPPAPPPPPPVTASPTTA